MAGASVKQVHNRAKRAWERAGKWDPLLNEVYSHALPQRNTFSGRGGEGELKMEHVVDSTAMISTARAAGRVQREMMPPYENFFQLEPGPLWPPETRDARKIQLENITRLVHLVLQNSNWPLAAHEMLLDWLSGRGNYMLLRGTRDRPVNCVAVARADVAIEEGPFGSIGGIFRKRNMDVTLIDKEYPGAKLPDDWLTEAKNKEVKKTVHECTFLDGEKWRSLLIADEGSRKLWETTYRRTSPWVVARYMKVTGEVDGRGPLMMALPDIRTCNAAVEMSLMAAGLAMSGVYTVTDDDIVNLDTVTIAPGVFIKVERNAGAASGPSIQALQTGRDFDISQIVIENLRASIRKTLVDNELPPEDGAVRSPTEYLARKKDHYEESGSAWARAQSEMIVPTVQRVLDILSDPAIGLIEDITIDQLLTKVTVTSPLANAQKLKEVQATMDWAGMITTLGGPQLLALAGKVEDMGQYLGERMGVSATVIRTEEDRAKMQQQIAQMITAQQRQPPVAA